MEGIKKINGIKPFIFLDFFRGEREGEGRGGRGHGNWGSNETYCEP